MIDGVEKTKTADAEEMQDAATMCSAWILSSKGTLVSMQLVDNARDSGIAKLVSGVPLTVEEAEAVAGI